jgi:hypothetical protein
MPRSSRAATVLAAILFLGAMAPLASPVPATATATVCGTYASETVPPPTIRVYRTASGAVETVDFRTYVKNVLSREWISSWTTESLRSGALAVKNYAWYQVLHWRGYTSAAGQCFDVFDSTRDQYYNPALPTYASAATAVDATWGTLAHRNGRIFPTYYNAGQAYEACGANANGWQMFQWGTQACGLDGKSAAQIMAIYYPGVVIVAAPPASTPPPAPTPAPTPTPAPAPTPPNDSVGSTPVPTPTLAPSPQPAPPSPPAPAAPQAPGGGQGLTAPPPAPPANPAPVVIVPAAAPVEAAPGPQPEPVDEPAPASVTLGRLVAFEAAADARLLRNARAPTGHGPAAVPSRWIAVRLVVASLLTSVLERGGLGWIAGAEEALGDELGGRNVLDRQTHRLEDGDRVRVAAGGPAAIDRADLGEPRFRR